MKKYVCLVMVCGLVFSGCSKNDSPPMNVHELVKLYAQKQGGDDYAGPELEKMGTKCRDELIRMIDDPQTPGEEVSAIVEILHIHFPCAESNEAIDRFGARIPDPAQRKAFQELQALIRKNDPRRH
jgi:hypothetical protein